MLDTRGVGGLKKVGVAESCNFLTNTANFRQNSDIRLQKKYFRESGQNFNFVPSLLHSGGFRSQILLF